MRYALLFPLAASFFGLVHAHATVVELFVNGVSQGNGEHRYIRSPGPPELKDAPVREVSSPDINCNVQNVPVPESVTVHGGDTVDFRWYHTDSGFDAVIDPSHVGPIVTYIAPRVSEGTGPVWTKIAEDGFSNGEFAVARLIANGGRYSVTIPPQLAAGDYLLRNEIIALHEADANHLEDPKRGSQHFPSCSQITVVSEGTVQPTQNFDFQTGYTPTDPGLWFNVYSGGDLSSYPIPGPRPFDFASASGGAPVPEVNDNGNQKRAINKKRELRWVA